ncbi:hypothetical protein PF005_g5294 [Phytophthora fragariae]|uniref:Uncharacterized protein n=1 Tax=Phytophthora fragariae TaxID=53985 RepID=A0A6A3LXR4_9STRA|nr:hypothetical protein PF011_g4230 [Phytophthora fragariae]KAE9226009.1 hypothetical protein PF005_g5294 [Phytophthora fragariae]KAE9250508.1 hypothetical protein PF004_g2906 [Phytophthora fragariae]
MATDIRVVRALLLRGDWEARKQLAAVLVVSELPELDTEVLVAHLCAKLVGSKCPGYEKDELRRNFKTGKYGKARLRHYFAL